MEFVNARLMAIKNPKTFTLPEQHEFDLLKKGDYVKIALNGERFWCEVIDLDREEEGISGFVSNKLILNEMEPGHKIDFKYENVYQIMNT